jgi:hypothetical protein
MSISSDGRKNSLVRGLDGIVGRMQEMEVNSNNSKGSQEAVKESDALLFSCKNITDLEELKSFLKGRVVKLAFYKNGSIFLQKKATSGCPSFT